MNNIAARLYAKLNHVEGSNHRRHQILVATAYYLLSRLLSDSSLQTCFTVIVFSMVPSKLSSLEAQISQKLGNSLVSAQWNTQEYLGNSYYRHTKI